MALLCGYWIFFYQPIIMAQSNNGGFMHLPSHSPQQTTQIAVFGDMPKIRPEALAKRINRAFDLGYDYDDIAQDAQFQKAAQVLLGDFEKRQHVFAPSTQKRLQSAWRTFTNWCGDNNHFPLPASPELIETYLEFRGQTFHRNTLNVDVWAISAIHQAAGCPDPTKMLIVRNTMKGIVRRKVREDNEYVKQARPFRSVHLDTLTELWLDTDNVVEFRNLVLMTIAYESLLRSAEIANIQLQHITVKSNGNASLKIPFTKTNQSGGGSDSVFISAHTLALINRYLAWVGRENETSGYLFTPLTRYGRLRKQCSVDDVKESSLSILKPMSTRSIDDVFLKVWFTLNPMVDSRLPISQIKAEHKPFTAHSARVGAAQDLLEQGYDSLQVRQAGRWKSDTMVAQYGQHILDEDSAMARSRKAKFSE